MLPTWITGLAPQGLPDDDAKVTGRKQQQDERLSKVKATMDALDATMSVHLSNGTTSKLVICFRCYKEGHLARTCPLRPRNRRLPPEPRQSKPQCPVID